ncbi:MAG: hypothetical protein K1X94_22570 [Sandaracinaceae bacterium]|nr:hypothetical protein [Sandaracinaceae bacterium]
MDAGRSLDAVAVFDAAALDAVALDDASMDALAFDVGPVTDASADGAVERACVTNDDCAARERCERADCDGPGTCVARPSACRPGGATVCGCDGTTYPSECEAFMAGTSVAAPAACGAACASTAECAPGEICHGSGCDTPGRCRGNPECLAISEPVCGCDGTTYTNACFAHRAGVRVDFAGECGAPPHCVPVCEAPLSCMACPGPSGTTVNRCVAPGSSC